MTGGIARVRRRSGSSHARPICPLAVQTPFGPAVQCGGTTHPGEINPYLISMPMLVPSYRHQSNHYKIIIRPSRFSGLEASSNLVAELAASSGGQLLPSLP